MNQIVVCVIIGCILSIIYMNQIEECITRGCTLSVILRSQVVELVAIKCTLSIILLLNSSEVGRGDGREVVEMMR